MRTIALAMFEDDLRWQSHSFAEVVDQACGGQEVHSGQAVGPRRVVMVAMDGEDGQPHIDVWVLEVHMPAHIYAHRCWMFLGVTGFRN